MICTSVGFWLSKGKHILQSSWFDHIFNNLSKLILFSILTMTICWTTSIYLNSCHSVFWHWQYAEQHQFRKTNVVQHILIVNMLNDINLVFSIYNMMNNINLFKLMLFSIPWSEMMWISKQSPISIVVNEFINNSTSLVVNSSWVSEESQ